MTSYSKLYLAQLFSQTPPYRTQIIFDFKNGEKMKHPTVASTNYETLKVSKKSKTIQKLGNQFHNFD